MRKRKTTSRSKYMTVQFDKTKMPEIVNWLKQQKNPEMSIYMLIRMAQQIGGNKDWADVTQKLASQVIFGKRMPLKSTQQPQSQPTPTTNNNQVHQTRLKIPSSKTRPNQNDKTKVTSTNTSKDKSNSKPKKSKPKKVNKKDLKGLGINKTWN